MRIGCSIPGPTPRTNYDAPMKFELIARVWRDYIARYKGDLALLVPALALVAAAGVSYGAIMQYTIDGFNAADRNIIVFAPLAVVVARSGVVRDRVLRLDLPQAELDLAARYINENFRGWIMEDMRAEIARRLEKERSDYDRLMGSIAQLYQQGALNTNSSAGAVFVEGAANLVTSEQDQQRLQDMLRTLEEKEKVVRLLSAYLDTRQEAVRVVIGLDETLPSMSNFVLIGAPARVGGEVMGSLAVIGPTRLDYQHTMSAVSYIARLFDKLLNESE